MAVSAIETLQQLLTCGTEVFMWHYDARGNLLQTNAEHLVLDKMLTFIGGKQYMLEYGRVNTQPLILGSDMGLMWCAVFAREKGTLQGIYLIGPVFHGELSPSFLKKSVERYHIAPMFQKQYLQILRRIPVVPSMMFLQYGLMLHYCVNAEKLRRSDIQFQPGSRTVATVTGVQEENETRLPTYYAEQTLLRILREGDLNYKQAITDSPHLFSALMMKKQADTIPAITRATGFATLCIREAITAGISPDTAYAVGEGYIGNMLQCRSDAELTSINLAMFEDFVTRVHDHRTDPKVSAQIRSCRDYIEMHAGQELKLAQLAKRVGYSEYYLSRKFRREMGVSISTYIKYVRVERAKLMLATTAMPVARIADGLHFASSSHFSEVFREVTGKTPQQYRTENQKF